MVASRKYFKPSSLDEFDGFNRSSKYFRLYAQIIVRAALRDCRPRYEKLVGIHERHHVIPISIGGDRGYHNTVVLTAKEHFVCHRLLPKFVIHPSHLIKMNFALFRLAGKHKGLAYGAREYAIAKQCAAKASSDLHKGVPKSKEANVKNSAAHIGDKNPFFGRKHTEESKRKIANNSSRRRGWKHSAEAIAIMSEKARNRKRAPRSKYLVISPSGYSHEVSDLKSFCEENSLVLKAMYSAACGSQLTHKGWTISKIKNDHLSQMEKITMSISK